MMALKFGMDSLSIGKNIFSHLFGIRRHSSDCTIHSENEIFDEKHHLADSLIEMKTEDLMHLEENVQNFDE